MKIPGNLLTTAMAVMPHTDVDRALELALAMDVTRTVLKKLNRILIVIFELPAVQN
jgi:hypothetical protein